MKNVLCCFLVIGFLAAAVSAQPELDTTFNSTGIQTVSFGINASGGDMVIQPDKKIVMAGSCQPSNSYQCVARYNEDGSLDTTFAQQGFLINFGLGSGSRVALQSDGKIVVGGSFRVDQTSVRVALARYTPEGVLDSSFGGGNVTFNAGLGLASPREMVIQPDGKIVIVGTSTQWSTFPTTLDRGWIARYLPNGSPDTSFGNNGVMNIPGSGVIPNAPQSACTSVAVQPDGKLLLGIRKDTEFGPYMLVRWNVDGTPDPTWGGGDGIVDIPPVGTIKDSIKNLTVMPDGRVLGTIYRNIVRFNPDGSFDTSFAGDGIRELSGTAGDPYDLTVSASGKITMAGLAPSSMNYWKFSVYKFRTDGSYDTGFGNNGLLVINPISPSEESNSSACAFDTEGRVVVVGKATTTPNRFVLVRLVAPPVMSVDVSGRVIGPNGNGVSGVTVSTSGITATTNPFGYYTLHNVQTNRTYVFSVRSKTDMAFNKRTILVDDNLTGIDFVGEQFDSRTIQPDGPAPKSLGPSIRKLR